MKKLFLVILVLTLTNCRTPEKNAKVLIKESLKETLHDWGSYEPVKFGTLDSVFTSVTDDPVYLKARSTVEVFSQELERSIEEYDALKAQLEIYYNYTTHNMAIGRLENAKRLNDTIVKYQPIMDSIEANYIPQFKGWSIDHSFRCNNALGNKTIHHYRFYFDPEITILTNNEDISNDALE